MPAQPGAHEVHLWQARLDVSSAVAAHLAATLSAAEHQRAARLRRPEDRAHYTAAHGWLRHLLASYLDAPPTTLVFELGAHGKPRLAGPGAPRLQFSLSHAGAVAGFAVACDADVGVDVEQVRDDVDIDGIGRRYFSSEQCAELDAASPAERSRTFFAMWTKHEAYLKATGAGLAGAHETASPPPGWTVTAFETVPGYAAAVATQGNAVTIPRRATELML